MKLLGKFKGPEKNRKLFHFFLDKFVHTAHNGLKFCVLTPKTFFSSPDAPLLLVLGVGIA
jgi:hypothetical protein